MLLTDLTTYLASESTGVPYNTTLVAGTNLFAGELPSDPAGDRPVAVALTEYPGREPEHDLGETTTRWEYPRFQLTVRATSHATGRLLAQQIKESLVAVVNTTLSGVKYMNIDALQSAPLQMPRDENRRWIWVWNFEAGKSPSTS